MRDFVTKIVLLISISIAFICEAHPQSVYLRGAVRDAFTNMGVEKSHVSLMKSDSTLVTSCMATVPIVTTRMGKSVQTRADFTQGAGFQLEVPQEGDYIVSVSMTGYEPEEKKIHVAWSSRPMDMGDIYLIPMAKELEELTVTGIKLNVYHKGDTLVYDASAFAMEKHNVLEDLVKRLPGVELRDGKVFANGRFVENIVIGGKDFLKKDPEQIMRILPAYIVDKLKFYEKMGEKSKTMGKDMRDASYVMDITMKRDYHGAWLGILDGGAGTQNRMEGLGYLMRFDDRQNISIGVDANNLGHDREPSSVATSMDDYSQMSDMKNIKGMLGYSYHPTDAFAAEVNASVQRQDKSTGAEEMFVATPGISSDLFRQSESGGDAALWAYRAHASVSMRPKKGTYGRVDYSFMHDHADESQMSQSVTGYGKPEVSDSLVQDLLQPVVPTDFNLGNIVNAYRDLSAFRSNDWRHDVAAEAHVATGDNLLKITGRFKSVTSRNLRNRDYLSRVFTEDIEQKMESEFNSDISENRGIAGVDYDINYADNSSKRGIVTTFYQLEWIGEDNRRKITDRDPNDKAHVNDDFDKLNSRVIKGNAWCNTAGAKLSHEFSVGDNPKWFALSASMSARYERKNVNCMYSESNNHGRHSFLLLSPEIGIRWHPMTNDRKGSKSMVELTAKMTQTSPRITDLADYTDTSDPMNIFKGNPGLRKQTTLAAALAARHYFAKSKSTLRASIQYTDMRNAISLESRYDSSTGMLTMTPINASGAREVSIDGGYGLPLSHNQKWWLDISSRGSLTRCANLVSYTDVTNDFSHVNLANYVAKATLRYNTFDPMISTSYTVSYRGNIIMHTRSEGTNFRDLSNSFSFIINLPGKISANADCAVVSRFGYSIPSLNKTLVLMNASISKSVFRDRFEIRLSAVDIFHQRKNISYTVTGSGSTERVNTRYVPPYLLLSVYYNWSYTPKKR